MLFQYRKPRKSIRWIISRKNNQTRERLITKWRIEFLAWEKALITEKLFSRHKLPRFIVMKHQSASFCHRRRKTWHFDVYFPREENLLLKTFKSCFAHIKVSRRVNRLLISINSHKDFAFFFVFVFFSKCRVKNLRNYKIRWPKNRKQNKKEKNKLK